MKHRTWIIALLLLCSLSCVCIAAEAVQQTAPDVIVAVDGSTTVHDRKFTLLAKVTFSGDAPRNDGLYLSVHIYGDGSEPILFEYERFKINLDESGHATVEIPINLDSIEATKDLENCTLALDIVDQENVFWYTLQDQYSFQIDTVSYAHSTLYDIFGGFIEHPILAAINVLTCLCLVVLLIRKRLRSGK